MERIMSDEEKIRRAIEISQRRNKIYYNINEPARVNVNTKKDYKLFKKMILQIIICLLIYITFYVISTTNYIFSEDVINKSNEILNYDVNFKEIYNKIQEFINLNINSIKSQNNMVEIEEKQEEITKELNVIEENSKEETIVEESANTENKENVNLQTETEIITEIKEEVSKSQMELDAEEVKKICNFQIPLKGIVSSEFGEREVTSSVMSANHKGIDIAAKKGTNIVSSIDGNVSMAEQNSDYGKYIKITNGEVMTVYAHCKELKVKEGDNVVAGQVIATVGSTGNSTGPHLHFEIRLSNRFINPRYVIDF